MSKRKNLTGAATDMNKTRGARYVALALAAMSPVAGFSMNFYTGNPDLELTWDNTIRYNAGWRMGKVDKTYLDDPGYDETEGRFKRGDMVTDRIDVLSEFETVWQKDWGIRISGSGWYDAAYGNHSRENPAFGGFSGNYAGDKYNGYTRKYVIGGGELLDAFAFGKFQIGETQLNVKAGQHNVYWGESLFSIGNSIAYSQGPVDTIKAATSPGAEAKELFLPLNQISAQYQLTPQISFGAQYLLNWKPFRLVPGGTFFSPADGTRSDYATPPAYAAYNEFLDNGPDLLPKKSGDFGLNMRVAPDWMSGTLGVYYRRFDEKLPWSFTQVGGGTTPGTVGAVRFNYARDTQLFGLSLNKSIAGMSVGSELSYRKDTALNSVAGYAVIPTGGAVTYDQAEGARGDTLHALVNAVYLLPQSSLWSDGNLNVELSYQHLRKITANADRFYACDGLSKRSGCSTRDALSLNGSFTPEWQQAFPGWDLSMPTSFGYGLRGNGPALAGGNEGALSWSVGATATLHQVYVFTLAYIDSYARSLSPEQQSGQANQNSHNWLSFTFKTTF